MWCLEVKVAEVEVVDFGWSLGFLRSYLGDEKRLIFFMGSLERVFGS